MEQWYVLQSKPNAEYQVVTALQRQGVQTYLPEIVSPKVSKKRTRRPFFPCYLFLRVDFEVISLSSVRRTPGLRRIVACDDRPTPLPDEVINQIWAKLNNFEAGDSLAHPFQQGDTVCLIDGPFQGMLAIFEGPTTPAERVEVLLTFLGQARRAQVPITYLEKKEPDTEILTPKRPRRTRGQGRRITRLSDQGLRN